jgi:hypothetical protein
LKHKITHSKLKKIIPQLYLWGLILMVISLPFSRFMLSVSQFALSGFIILEFMSYSRLENIYKKYPLYISFFISIGAFPILVIQSLGRIFRKFLRRENMPAIIFTSLYILHVIGLLFTVDFDYALKDLRIKLPLLVLPVFFSVTASIDKKQFRRIMLFFAFAVVASTIVSTYILLTRQFVNLRDISIFISHIRFGLLISLAIFTLAYYSTRKDDLNHYLRFLLIALCGWLILYLLISASITGLVVLFIAVFVIAIHYTINRKNLYSRIATVVLLLTPIVIMVFIMGIITDVYKIHKVDFSNLEKQTAAGGYYWHDTTNLQTENGTYVWLYISTDELRNAWNKRSELSYDGKDNLGQDLKHTLIRYLSSKGLHKDAEGVNNLSSDDIALVEDGEASYHYHERSVFYIRIYKTIWEIQQYLRTGNPSGHSAMQRIEYWKTSVLIIKQHPVFGVGTGDMNIAFAKQYELMNSPLQPEFRWRSHNQFLSITVGFGLVGIIWFLVVLLYPSIKKRRMNDYFFLSFFVIMIVSMLSEDTIETQAGVTIFAFFTSLFIFGKKDKTSI